MSEPLIHYVESTDSTMLEARRLVEAAEAAEAAEVGLRPRLLSGTVVQAGYQTAGRGRISERKWESNPGDSLLFTVIFSKEDLKRRMSGRPFTLLPLLCGLAVAETLEQLLRSQDGTTSEAEIRVKWPNDVLADGRKISGILCEASGEWVYAGIGINMNQNKFAENLRRPACSLSMLMGNKVDGKMLLRLVLMHLYGVLSRDNWQAAVDSRLYRIGKVVGMKQGLAEERGVGVKLVEGVLSGIDSSGALLIKTDIDVEVVNSGELLI